MCVLFFSTREKSVLGADDDGNDDGDDDDDDDDAMFIPGFTLMKGMRCAGVQGGNVHPPPPPPLPALWDLATKSSSTHTNPCE